MTNKLIKDMDDETWRIFVAFCKLKNIRINDQLKEILDEFIDKNMARMFKGDKK